MPPSIPRRAPNRPPLFVLALLAMSPATAGAGSAQGALSVSVQVVESCRVPTANGLGSELVPCPTTRGRAESAGAAASGASAGRTVAARTVVERTRDGIGYLTTIY